MSQLSKMQELEKKIVAKAWKDPAFKKKLLANPKTAIKEMIGVDVARDYTIRVVEDTPKSHTIVLPPHPALHELSDEEMEKVVGGAGGRNCWPDTDTCTG